MEFNGFLVLFLILFSNTGYGDSCLKSLIPGFKEGCLIECELYFKENPEARPKDDSEICANGFENLKNAIIPFYSYNMAMHCLGGVLNQSLSLPQQFLIYSRMISDFKEETSNVHQQFNAFLENCDKDLECKRTVARKIYKYHLQKENGEFVVPDQELDNVIASHSAHDLWQTSYNSQLELIHACTKTLATIPKKTKNRFEYLKQKIPDCPWALNIYSEEDLTFTNPSNSEGSWLSQLGIKLQCYSPRKKSELFCYEIAHLILNPITVVSAVSGGAALSLRALSAAGIRESLKKEGVQIAKQSWQKTRTAIGEGLSQAEKDKINKAYREAVFNYTQRGKAAQINFETQLNHLIKDLTPAEKKELDKILQNYNLKTPNRFFDADNDIRGQFNRLNRTINITLPKELHGTDLEYLIKMHEAYHAVNAVKTAQKLNIKNQKKLDKFLNDIKLRYYDEAGAMAQEWKYIDAVPNEIKETLLKEINQHHNIHPGTKAFLIKALTSGSENATQYVNTMHSMGRYDRSNIIHATQSQTTDELKKSTLNSAAAYVSTFVFCFSEKKKNETDSMIYQHICKNLPLMTRVFQNQ